MNDSSAADRRWTRFVDWTYLPGLILLFAGLVILPSSAVLRDVVSMAFVVVIVVAVIVRLRPGHRPKPILARSALDFVAIAVVALILSATYWYRVAFVMTGWDHIGFRIITSLAWWLPAVAFAVLYRHPGEAWSNQGRGRFFARLLVAAVAALPGLLIQNALHDQRAVRGEQVGVTTGLHHILVTPGSPRPVAG